MLILQAILIGWASYFKILFYNNIYDVIALSYGFEKAIKIITPFASSSYGYFAFFSPSIQGLFLKPFSFFVK
jgi:hypothetical protein